MYNIKNINLIIELLCYIIHDLYCRLLLFKLKFMNNSRLFMDRKDFNNFIFKSN